jgi:hypothetical protein
MANGEGLRGPTLHAFVCSPKVGFSSRSEGVLRIVD